MVRAATLIDRKKKEVDNLDACGTPTSMPQEEGTTIQATIRVPQDSVGKLLKASGLDGVWIRPMWEEAKQQGFRVVHLPRSITIAGATRMAARMDFHLGIVKTKNGFAVRILGSKYEEAVKLVSPDDAEELLLPKFEVSGLPLGCGREAMRDLIPGWPVKPLFTYQKQSRRTWIVAAKE